MAISALRCTSCLAPVDASRGARQRCVYCGMTLVLDGSGAPPLERPALTGNDSVVLTSHGGHLIMVIKVVREHTGLGLKDAKELVEAAPCTVAQGWDPARADRFRADLREAGAVVD